MYVRSSTRTPWRTKLNPVIFCLISVVQGLVVTGLELPILFTVRGVRKRGVSSEEVRAKFYSITVYIIIFIGSQLFQILLSIESVFFKNTIQMFGVIAFNIMALLYSVTQYFQIQKLYHLEDNDVELFGRSSLFIGLVAITIGVGQVSLILFGFKLYKEFGWKIYRRLGSDLTLRKYFMTYHVLTMFLKFDLFFFLGFIVQFLNFTIQSGDTERTITIICLPVSLAILVFALFSVHMESRWMGGVSCTGFAVGIAYFIFKIVRILTKEKYDNYKYFLLMFAFLSLAAISVSLVLLVLCIRNFEKGLTPHIQISLKSRQSIRRRNTLDLQGE